MPVNTRPSIVSFALKTLAAAVTSAVLVSANAAGLGKLTVLSSLGQPLRAEIELTAVTPEEAGGLSAKLASPETFRTANIKMNPALSSLRFEVEQRNGRQLIRVSSSQPLTEPFVDLLLELSWNGGRMVREYTFLLDPPEVRAAQAPQVAAPVDLGQARTPTITTTPASAPVAAAPTTPATSANPATPKARTAKPAADAYTVKQGDTLTRIANQVKPTEVSLDVMLVALYRANPEAFSGNNMNRLKSGHILAVPDADAIRSAGAEAGEARSVVVAHARDFNAYRARLAGQVANSSAARDGDAGQSSSGKIAAKVEEKPNAVNAARDKLTLSKSSADTSGKPGAGKTGTSVEDGIARQKQVDDAAARVKELEKNVGELEKLMAVKSKAAAPAPAASTAASVPVIDNTAPAEAPKSKPVIPPRSLGEASLFEKLAANVQWLGVAVAGLLLLLVGVLVARRRKKFVVPHDESGYLGVPAAPVNPPVEPTEPAAAQAPAADQDNNVFGSGFAPSATQLDSDEVDPVAEADAYLAYNRDAQAEEILKEALRRDPDHHAARLKLLDIYATRGDARSFESHASELYALTRGQGEEWEQAAELGRKLEPGNPLYAAGTGDAGGTDGAGKAADNGYGGAPLAAGVAAVAAATAAAAYGAAHSDDAATPEFGAEPAFGADTAPAAPADEPFLPASAEPFDFANDLDTALPQAVDASVSPASIAAQANAADFGLGDLDFTSPAPAPAPEPGQPLVAADDPSMDFSFDLPADPVHEEPAASSVPLDSGDTDFTIPEVPALVEPPALPTAPAGDDSNASTAQEFDLSGIDLDLNSRADEAPAVEEVAAADVARAEPMSALHMEMDTKLDLAVAYQEIGDKEGARELLDEVLRGGSDEQVAKANAMKEQLG